MYNICVFAGTTEGRELAEYLKTQDTKVTVCVATEYGKTLVPDAENLIVSAKRLPPAQIAALLQQERFDLVVDATHPYAASITESIRETCAQEHTDCIRLLRPASDMPADAVFVQSAAEAAAYLSAVSGKVLLTVGSKELPAFAAVPDAAERMYPRVLPMPASLQACADSGFPPAHIIAMQGPFTHDMNLALLRSTGAQWVVTKDGGAAGGFPEKVSAARAAGARLLVIGRPAQREGMDLPETIRYLQERFGFTHRPEVIVAGIGPGNVRSMTQEVRDAMASADCLIGAGRMVAGAAANQTVYEAIAPDKIAAIIREHPEYDHIVVLMSGDSSFFSGTKKLLPLLTFCKVRVLPGISSLSYLCAALQTSCEDVVPFSLHGRNGSILPVLRRSPRVFTLVGGEHGVRDLCRMLTDAGFGDSRVSVGSRLSYEDECLTIGTAAEFYDRDFPALSAVLVERGETAVPVTHGLPDAVFQRGGSADGVVPMTKREIRSVSLSALQLQADSVCWDVGAGTGSVSIEMALQAYHGSVYAIEKKEAALDLLQENIRKLGAGNVVVIAGSAPESCEALPAPTHVFIGGSSGNMRDILTLALQKNTNVRIVATAIALETVAELAACMQSLPFRETETVCVNVSRDRKAGSYHLMTAQNPVYIFTMQGNGENR